MCLSLGGYITDNIIFYRELGFRSDQLLTWIKHRFTLTRKEYQLQTEQILFLVNGALKHRNKLRSNATAIFGPAPMAVKFDNTHRKIHPCAKPVELLERFILNHSKKGRDRLRPVYRRRLDFSGVRTNWQAVHRS